MSRTATSTPTDTPLPFADRARPSVSAPGTRSRRLGLAVGALPVLFLSVDGVFKVLRHPEVLKASATLGIPESITVAIGLILLSCTALSLNSSV